MKILSAVAAIIFFAVRAMAETTNGLSDAEIQGRQLAKQLCEMRPDTNFSQSGILSVRDGTGDILNIPIKFEVFAYSTEWYQVSQTNWLSLYQAFPTNGLNEELQVTHNGNLQNKYFHHAGSGIGRIPEVEDQHVVFPGKPDEPFIHSDFSIGDLGLEFFCWPQQKVLKKEVRRSRGCTVLESTNPNPTNGYSRVVSWIDDETLGIVHAEAYDANGKLLKEFDPKSFKKVNGQWQLQEMEIRNVQTGSRSRMEFDVKNQ